MLQCKTRPSLHRERIHKEERTYNILCLTGRQDSVGQDSVGAALQGITNEVKTQVIPCLIVYVAILKPVATYCPLPEHVLHHFPFVLSDLLGELRINCFRQREYFPTCIGQVANEFTLAQILCLSTLNLRRPLVDCFVTG
jgi:hypothetical protein